MVCKLAGVILVLACAAGFAGEINGMEGRRFDELRRLYNLLVQLKSELKYMNTPLPDCFNMLSKQSKAPFAEWLCEVAASMQQDMTESFSEIWERNIGILEGQSALTKEDLILVSELKDKLGSMDMEVQEKSIDYVLLQLEEHRDVLKEEMRNRKKVVVTLCMFVGFMTIIILL